MRASAIKGVYKIRGKKRMRIRKYKISEIIFLNDNFLLTCVEF